VIALSDLDFDYPDDLVARHPAEPRDHARLMVIHRATGRIEHRRFYDLPDYFEAGDVLVVNDTRVFPARLIGTKAATGARVEVFLLRPLPEAGPHTWRTLAAPAKKLRVSDRVTFAEGLAAEVVAAEGPERTVRFDFAGTAEDFQALLDRIGHVPLPPYLRREDGPEDRADYQTVFAAHRGAVAAPTAGLHFTEALLDRLRSEGVHIAPVTLHVGLGTFQPITAEDATQHRMHPEAFSIPDATASLATEAHTRGRLTAVGTTSVRALETAASPDGIVPATSGWSEAFIYPPYRYRVVDRLITNFHTPRSTLLLLVAAFMGDALMREAYRVAVAERYRLFSYGDAMLIV
jgi:S-adenosylmethionine:tRNA ribosyltransferase-isomerase